MDWDVLVKIEPTAQAGDDFCGAACVQMVLSTLGLRVPDTLQYRFNESVAFWKGPWGSGNPVGVACTINRFNTGGATGSQTPARPSIEYRTARHTTPYKSCATIVNALHAHSAASIAMVFGGSHWVVVYGGEGNGTPEGTSPYTITGLWIVNPDNGFFAGAPGHPTPGFVLEHLTYEAFLYTYFSGTDGIVSQRDMTPKYCDGREFIIVTDSRARRRGKLQLPIPQNISARKFATIDAGLEHVLGSNLATLATATQKRPLRVRRIDRGDELYYLVPYAMSDKTVSVVRLDKNFELLGITYGFPNDGRFDDDGRRAIEGASESLSFATNRLQSLSDQTFVWRPSRESASPYNPFYHATRGLQEAYALLNGAVHPRIHDLRTGRAFGATYSSAN